MKAPPKAPPTSDHTRQTFNEVGYEVEEPVVYDDGSATATVSYLDGRSTTVILDANGNLFRRTEFAADGAATVTEYAVTTPAANPPPTTPDPFNPPVTTPLADAVPYVPPVQVQVQFDANGLPLGATFDDGSSAGPRDLGVTGNLLDAEYTLHQFHQSGTLSDDFFSFFTTWTSAQLLGSLAGNPFLPPPSGLDQGADPAPSSFFLDPIGAFYNSQGPANDQAALDRQPHRIAAGRPRSRRRGRNASTTWIRTPTASSTPTRLAACACGPT